MEGLYRYLVRRTSGARAGGICLARKPRRRTAACFSKSRPYGAHTGRSSPPPPASAAGCHATAAQRAYRRRRRHAAPRAVRMAALDVRSGCGSRGRDRGRGSLAGRAALAGSRAVPVLCQPYRRRGRPASGGRDAGVAQRRHRVAPCRRQGGRGADRAARRRGLFRRVARCAASFVVETRELAIRVLGTAFNVRALAGNPLTEVVLRTRRRTPRKPRRRQPRVAASQPALCTTPGWATWRWSKSTRSFLCDQALQPGHDEGRHDHGDHRRHRKELRRTHTHHRRPTMANATTYNYPGAIRSRRPPTLSVFMTGTHCEVIRNEIWGLRPTTAGLLHRTTRNTLHEHQNMKKNSIPAGIGISSPVDRHVSAGPCYG